MKKDYKIVVADIDRTLRDPGRPLWQNLLKHAEEWQLGFQFDFIIGLNGGEIYDSRKNETVKLNLLQPDTIKEIITGMAPSKCNPFIYREGYMLAQWDDELLKGPDPFRQLVRKMPGINLIKNLRLNISFEFWKRKCIKMKYNNYTIMNIVIGFLS